MDHKKIISEFSKSDKLLTKEWEVSIDVSILKKIFKPYEDDPDLVMVYSINRKNATELLKYQNFEFDFKTKIYEMGTYI